MTSRARRPPPRHLKQAVRRRRRMVTDLADIFHMMYPLLLLAALIVFSGLHGFRLLLPHPAAIGVCVPAPVILNANSVGLAPGEPWRDSVLAFTGATGVRPAILEDYQLFGQSFDQDRACHETQMGAVPLIQVLPRRYSLAAIAAGQYDSYLNSYANAVAAFADPVIISFAHEMNAVWWPWGYGFDTPKIFKAAWRHIVTLFRDDGATNVIWMWDVNKDALPGQITVTPPAEWWPGGRYVGLVGVDGYFNTPSDTFSDVFAPTLASIRAFTRKPVVIAETATAPSPVQAAQIDSLFAGVRASNVTGFIWFDIDSREHWHIEGRPAADVAFRAAVMTYRKPCTYRQGRKHQCEAAR